MKGVCVECVCVWKVCVESVCGWCVGGECVCVCVCGSGGEASTIQCALIFKGERHSQRLNFCSV